EVGRVEVGVFVLVAVAGDAVNVAAADHPSAATGTAGHVAEAGYGRWPAQAVGQGVAAEAARQAGTQGLSAKASGRVAEDLKTGATGTSGCPFAPADRFAECPQIVRF